MIYISTMETAGALRRAFEPLWREEQSSAGLGPLFGVRHTARAGDPAGMCILTSETLRILDPSWSTVYGAVDGREHTWCERAGLVLDLTGDQFDGYPPVLLGSRPAGYSRACWCGADHQSDAVSQMTADERHTAGAWAPRVLAALELTPMTARAVHGGAGAVDDE